MKQSGFSFLEILSVVLIIACVMATVIILNSRIRSTPVAQLDVIQLRTPTENDKRFTIVRVARFGDSMAYNQERGIYILTDAKTGQEYVGISGIGVSELGSHKSGKSTVTDER
jgi:hypothetical protein